MQQQETPFASPDPSPAPLPCPPPQSEGGFSDYDADARSNYLFNSTIAGVDAADAILLVGCNPRLEAPVLNARIRAGGQRGEGGRDGGWRQPLMCAVQPCAGACEYCAEHAVQERHTLTSPASCTTSQPAAANLSGVPVAAVGQPYDLTYPAEQLGEGADALDALLKPSSEFLKRFKGAARPMVVVGAGVLARGDRDAVLQKVQKLVEKAEVVREGWNGFNIMHDSAARVAALDIGFLPSARARASTGEPARASQPGPASQGQPARASPAAYCEGRMLVFAVWALGPASLWHPDICLLPSQSVTLPPALLFPHCPLPCLCAASPKFVYLLGSDDFSEADVPADAFVVYQVGGRAGWAGLGLAGRCMAGWARRFPGGCWAVQRWPYAPTN